ncbi:hypothetical protein RFI_37181 [Reticulomyxa filosa]|uniref:Uncharacterized protein n=1 Tax=Reticulomyxa filosa TaxID=46433 RepID=X6LFW7_RETFI|nr:hypothetical protein RFI_37181 [Reticulomyxa filosa]|eukprot:ETO00266.1 hypothetical protein RFI_37181 [Reticulomyxa filosa]
MWFNKSVTPNKERIDLISFKDLITIRSFKELKDCDQFWKLSSQNKNALFWSMSICYSLLKTTDAEMWDQLFAHESSFIEKYGLDAYLEESMPPFHNPVPNFVKDETTPPFFIFFPPNFNLREIKLLCSQEKEPWTQQHLTKSIIFFVVVLIPFFAIFENNYVSGAALSIACLENFFFTCSCCS